MKKPTEVRGAAKPQFTTKHTKHTKMTERWTSKSRQEFTACGVAMAAVEKQIPSCAWCASWLNPLHPIAPGMRLVSLASSGGARQAALIAEIGS